MSGRRITQFGSISRTAQQERIDRAEETDNFFLGCIVGSFGIAITLALVLLPLSICCTALIYHPIFVVGVVLFIVLTVFGAILCIFHPFIAKWWWYKDETTGICSTAEPGPSPTNIYCPYVVGSDYPTTNEPLSEHEPLAGKAPGVRSISQFRGRGLGGHRSNGLCEQEYSPEDSNFEDISDRYGHCAQHYPSQPKGLGSIPTVTIEENA